MSGSIKAAAAVCSSARAFQQSVSRGVLKKRFLLSSSCRVSGNSILHSSCRWRLPSATSSFYSSQAIGETPSEILGSNSPSVYEKVNYVVNNVPVGLMEPEHIEFCRNFITDCNNRRLVNEGRNCEILLERLIIEASMQGSEGILSTSDFAKAIRTLARTELEYLRNELSNSTPTPFSRAKAILNTMIERHARLPSSQPAPDRSVYDAVLYVASRTSLENGRDTADEALNLIHKLEEEALQNPDLLPSTSTYNYVLHLYGRISADCYGAAASAEDLLMHFSNLSSEGVVGSARPDTLSFNCVLDAWSKSAEDKGADRAKEILQFMLTLGSDHRNVRPDETSFGSVIDAFGRRGRPKEATEMYELATSWFAEGDRKGRMPDLTGCLNAVLTAWELSDDPRAPEAAEDLVREAENLHENPYERISVSELVNPNSKSYRSIINTHLKSGRDESVSKANERLMKLVQGFEKGMGPPPDRDVFHSLLEALVDKPAVPDAVESSHTIVQTMLRLSQTRGVECHPTWTTLHRLLLILTRQEYKPATAQLVVKYVRLGESLRLMSIANYDMAIHYLSHMASAVQAAQIIERLPTRVKTEYKRRGREHGGSAAFVKTLVGLSKMKTQVAADHAIRVLRMMQDLNMTITARTYTAVVAAFSRARDPVSIDTACAILEEAIVADANPNKETRFGDPLIFSLVIESLSYVGTREAAAKAYNFLSALFRLYSHGRPELAPSIRTLDGCLSSLCQAQVKEDAENAVRILKVLGTKKRKDGSAFLPSSRVIEMVRDSCEKYKVTLDLTFLDGLLLNASGDDLSDETSEKLQLVNSLVAHGDLSSVQEADKALQDMVLAYEEEQGPLPNQRIFHSVISGWCTLPVSAETARKAELLLHSMIRLEKTFATPSLVSKSIFDRCLWLWTSLPHSLEGAEHVAEIFGLAAERGLVNLFTYTTAVRYLAEPSTATRAALLMERLPNLLERDLVEKNSQRLEGLFRCTISAFSRLKQQDAAYQALKLYRLMQELGIEPTAHLATAVVAAFSHQRDLRFQGAQYGMEVWRECMVADADPNSSFRFHDQVLFAVVLELLTYSEMKEAPEQASLVLNEMFRLYLSGRRELEPNTRCLNACLNTMCNAASKAELEKAIKLVQLMGIRKNSEGSVFKPSEKVLARVHRFCRRFGIETSLSGEETS